MFRKLNSVPKDNFLKVYNRKFPEAIKIDGTALYLIRDVKFIPPYILHSMFKNDILYKKNIFVSIIRTDGPWGIKSGFIEELAQDLKVFEIHLGYMETDKVADVLHKAGIKEKVIFYGTEELVTDKFVWKIFSAIKKLAPSYVEFYRLPASKLHGVATRIEM
jgi:KUP system potassium uptake protein